MTQYDKLLALPLFQGLGQHELWRIVETMPFAFTRHRAHQDIVTESNSCSRLVFLIDGSMTVKTQSADRGYTLMETLKAPQVIEPERLFGLTQRFLRTYTALAGANTLSIDRTDVIQLTEQYMIFRLNLLNIISTQSQRLQQHLWMPYPKDLRQRIVRFFLDRCLRPAGEKTFVIKMVRLAQEVNANRLKVSVTLNQLQTENLIQLSRGRITIPQLEKLK